MSFIPSRYSNSFSPAATRNPVDASCTKHRDLQKAYTDAMWKEPIFSKKRQALESKANAEAREYTACKAAGGKSAEHKLTKGVRDSVTPVVSPPSSVPGALPAPADVAAGAEAEAAAAAAAAEASVGGGLPVIGLGIVGVLVLAGGAYFIFGGKRHKKKKKKKHSPEVTVIHH